jgi:hypothetical protein
VSGEEDIEASLTAGQLVCPLGHSERAVLGRLIEAIGDMREDIPTWLKGVEVEMAGVKGGLNVVNSGLGQVKQAVDKTNGTVVEHARRIIALETAHAADEGFAKGIAAARQELHGELEASAKIAAAEITATAKLAERALAKRQQRVEFVGKVVSHDVFKYAIGALMLGVGLGGVVELAQRVGLM